MNKKSAVIACASGVILFLLPVLVTFGLGGVSGIMKWGSFEWVMFALLGAGFGLQMFFFLFLRALLHFGSTTTLSGASSGAAMLACCTHYLVGVVPALGASGLATVLAREQRTLLVVAFIINLIALVFVSSRYRRAKRNINKQSL